MEAPSDAEVCCSTSPLVFRSSSWSREVKDFNPVLDGSSIILQPLHEWDEDHVHLLTTSKVPHMPPGVELMSQFHLFEEMLVKLEQEAAGEEGGPTSGPVSGSNSGTDRRSYEDEDFRMCKL